MPFHAELCKGFSAFLEMIQKDKHTDVLLMPYAEYSLQFYVIYHDALYKGLLCENSPMAKAFRDIGIDQPRDQLLVFLNTFYLYWHTRQDSL